MSQHAQEHPIATIWRWIGLFQHGILRVFGLILIFFVVLSIPGCIVGMTMGGDQFKLADSGVLRLTLDGRIVEEKTRIAPGDAFSAALLGGAPDDEILLDDLLEGLEIAAQDDAVNALVLDFEGFQGATPAALYVVADALRAFRDTGKPVIAHEVGYGLGTYVLAAQASEVSVHPFGMADVRGFTAFQPYFAPLLENLRVTVNVFRVGTFKSAVEPLLLAEQSPEAREAAQFVFDDIWNDYKAAAAAGRGFEPEALQRYGDNAALIAQQYDGRLAEASVAEGLVDEALSRRAFLDGMQERFGEDGIGYESSSFWGYLNHNRPEAKSADDTIAVINFVGSIVDGDGDGGVIGGDDHARLIREAREDDDVRAIVMRIDSGGGSALASELIREELLAVREAGIPIIASMGGVAASGGYWIATPANEIWAHPSTITGSIGIFGLIPTFENTLEWAGVNFDGITTTQTGNAIDPTTGVTEAGAIILQESIEEGYRQFLQRVADARNMTIEEVDAVAQGRIWTGRQALDRGLVDQLGGFEEAVARAAEIAGLEEGAFRVKVIEDEYDPFEEFLRELGLEASVRAVFGEGVFGGVFAPAGKALGRVSLLNDPNNVYAICLACEGFVITD